MKARGTKREAAWDYSVLKSPIAAPARIRASNLNFKFIAGNSTGYHIAEGRFVTMGPAAQLGQSAREHAPGLRALAYALRLIDLLNV
jgi:hypothetical protein